MAEKKSICSGINEVLKSWVLGRRNFAPTERIEFDAGALKARKKKAAAKKKTALVFIMHA
jgi:hypothetical protein